MFSFIIKLLWWIMSFLDVSEAGFLPSSGVKGKDLMQLASTKGVSLRKWAQKPMTCAKDV
jgi:hypothetical protein